jgi:bacterioferritin (cytochrome b1)
LARQDRVSVDKPLLNLPVVKHYVPRNLFEELMHDEGKHINLLETQLLESDRIETVGYGGEPTCRSH